MPNVIGADVNWTSVLSHTQSYGVWEENWHTHLCLFILMHTWPAKLYHPLVHLGLRCSRRVLSYMNYVSLITRSKGFMLISRPISLTTYVNIYMFIMVGLNCLHAYGYTALGNNHTVPFISHQVHLWRTIYIWSRFPLVGLSIIGLFYGRRWEISGQTFLFPIKENG